MKKYLSYSVRGLVLAAVITSSVAPVPLSADVPAAITYLQAQANDAWKTQALVAAGQPVGSTDYLKSVSGSLATDYAKAILATVAAGQDPKTFGNTDYVAALKALQRGNQMGDDSLLNDDIWSILALASVRQADSAQATNAKQFILAHQKSDGGWGYATNGLSDSNDTAAAIMALLEVGLTPTSPEITRAVTYLQSTQNDDGGFGYDPSSPSDSASDSWVIAALNKLGISPSTWARSANTPLTHLASFQATDGGYWWLDPTTTEFNNKAMTPFAIIALSGKSFPVAYGSATTPDPEPEPPAVEAGMARIRIEGKTAQICDASVAIGSALQAIERAATTCGYTFVIAESALGSYLSQINQDAPQGTQGWLYAVNNTSASVGASEYQLQTGDTLLWWYGEWNWPPTRLTAGSATVNEGQPIVLKAEYFNGSSWLGLPGATVRASGQQVIANATGDVSVSLPSGAYDFVIDHPGYIRSDAAHVDVGEGTGQVVGLQTEISQGSVAGDILAFTVTPAQLNFGQLRPGERGRQTVTITNQGRPVQITARVTGDAVFTDNLLVDTQSWSRYANGLTERQAIEPVVELMIPSTYLDSGIKRGELIFWGASE
jgi:hypothetical protein